ncbi:hypothetical protein [Scytonema millei]|uniref:Uncharacterized protein n=1 Tax=Scytonema millei VB511283 TaxID=1245923 RepID=A0A9X5E2A5_9CYAN|nr:hypothetical protein [Scytonema millei]NHC33804.1 hypothetical protein [Scytonema millei VB511283]
MLSSDDYGSFVPQFCVTFGLLLGLASIGVVIYFIFRHNSERQLTPTLS